MNAHTNTEEKGETLDIKEFLTDSLYYPCSGFDITPIEVFRKDVNKFVYADDLHTEEEFLDTIKKGIGRTYTVLSTKKVNIDNSFYDFSYIIEVEGVDMHKFTILYVCGDGALTYGNLYLNNKIIPKVLTLIKNCCSCECGDNMLDENGQLGHLVSLGETAPTLLFIRTNYSSDPSNRKERWAKYFKKTPIRIYTADSMRRIDEVAQMPTTQKPYYMIRIRR